MIKISIPQKIQDNILRVYSGETPPKVAETGKTFHIADGVRVGDIVGTEFGIYQIDRWLGGRKYKGRLVDSTKDAYFVEREYSQNALTFANAKKEKV